MSAGIFQHLAVNEGELIAIVIHLGIRGVPDPAFAVIECAAALRAGERFETHVRPLMLANLDRLRADTTAVATA